MDLTHISDASNSTLSLQLPLVMSITVSTVVQTTFVRNAYWDGQHLMVLACKSNFVRFPTVNTAPMNKLVFSVPKTTF